MNFDHWTGPAPIEPIQRANVHYDWHWVFSTGNGDIGNQGVHQMDIARWGLGLDRYPGRVRALGARLGYDDDGETPNTQIAHYDYGDKEIVFEVRGLKTGDYRGAAIGVVFDAADGLRDVLRGGLRLGANPLGCHKGQSVILAEILERVMGGDDRAPIGR